MRTDVELRQDVLDQFRKVPGIESAEIGVGVKDGVVTLSGNVDSYNKKWAAGRSAARVAGVRALAEQIQVRYTGVTAAFRGLLCQ